MERFEHTKYVGQRQYGIIAPDRDRLGITQLITNGFYPCFALSLFDQKAHVGMLTHLDSADSIPGVVDEVLPMLKEWGARRLQLSVANLDNKYTSAQRLIARKDAVAEAIETIRAAKILGTEEVQDLEQTDAAILNALNGLSVTSIANEDLTPEFRAILMANMQRIINHTTREGTTAPITAVYVPQPYYRPSNWTK